MEKEITLNQEYETHFYSHGVKFCCLAKVAGIQQRHTEGVLWCNDSLLCLYFADRLGLQGNYKTIGRTIRQNFCTPIKLIHIIII